MNKKTLIIPVIAIIAIALVFASTYVVEQMGNDAKKTDVVAVVNGVIELYKVHGEQSFGMITSNQNYIKSGQSYPFVLNGDLSKIVAHGFKPIVVGTAPSGISDANISIPEMITALENDGSVWVEYKWENPDDGMEEPKTTYLKSHDGYVFGSGFYSP